VGTWSGPVWNNCQNPFQSGLQYTISAVSDTLLLVDYVYGAGNGSAYATYSGSTATGSNTTLTLDAGATPPTITILNTVACMHGVLTKR
jgi:hypothetical protein